MKWIIDNWSLIVVIICAIFVALIWARKFSQLPSQEQQAKVKAFLLAIVVEAERQFGSQTGRVKLSWAYSKFIEAFPAIAPVVPFEVFSEWVDEVLDQMRIMLSDNSALRDYIDGEATKLPFK